MTPIKYLSALVSSLTVVILDIDKRFNVVITGTGASANGKRLCNGEWLNVDPGATCCDVELPCIAVYFDGECLGSEKRCLNVDGVFDNCLNAMVLPSASLTPTEVGECEVTRLAPVDYRQRKQNNAKVSDGLLSGVLFL
ncbi:hypothetical protein NDU88_005862 [Pleurodeles waltl]|uniref:Uncharacterized protein n=1 Tax=Pleurodeles waltl TaxID=8319 RepID=A0AAV7L2J5_PLEWA|nr:hypothetical protein NDU88_005862 [Pleurodeles waltl]